MSKYNDVDSQEQYLARLRGIPQPDIAPEYVARSKLSKSVSKHKIGYPRTEILEGGDIAEWIANRRTQLVDQAEANKQEAGMSGMMGLGVVIVGFVLSGVNPLATLAIACGATGYGISLVANMKKFGGLKPIPFSSASLIGMLDRSGAESREYMDMDEPDEYLEIVEFLPSIFKAEFLLLAQYEGEMTALLARVGNGKRFQCYRFLLDFYRKNSQCLSDPGTAKHLLDKLQTFALTVNPDPTLDLNFMQQVSNFVNQIWEAPQETTALSIFAAMPSTEQDDLSLQSAIPPTAPTFNIGALGGAQTKMQSLPDTLNLDNLKSLPIQQRGLEFIKKLETDGLQISRAINKQITAICGNQRGGKGTLMGIFAILSKAIEPQSEIHYFTAGDDIYPFNCEQLTCRKSFDNLPGDAADEQVASRLFDYLKEMDRAANGSMENVILVIDEAVALGDYMPPENKVWMVRFLLSRASKKGAQIFIVLHGNNLTSWIGTGNTSGLSSTFKQDVNFIGCKSKSVKKSALRSMAIATGEYFLADPAEFGKAIEGGDLGKMPNWMLAEKHPVNGAPDPVRTLLKYFPELETKQILDSHLADHQDPVLQQRIKQVRDVELLFEELSSTIKSLDGFILEELYDTKQVTPERLEKDRNYIVEQIKINQRVDLLEKFNLS